MYKHLTASIVIMLITACSPSPGVPKPSTSFKDAWADSQPCTLRLVAYRTSKHSKYYLEEMSTGAIFLMSGLGGRRIPTLALGETLQSKCDRNEYGDRITEFEYYRTSIVVHTHGTVEKALVGYEHLVNTR